MSDIIKQYMIEKEPYYRAVADEVELYEAAYGCAYPLAGLGNHRFM